MRRLVAILRLSLVWNVVILALGLLAVPLPTDAQQAAKVKKIGVIATEPGPLTKPFKQTLRELGWREGQNLAIEWRFSEGEAERFPVMAAELVRLQVDVIFAASAPAIRAVKQATTTIPIVFSTLADAVAMGFVTNLARPGGNLTGVTGFAPELGGKWLELLQQVVPGVTRVAVLTNPGNPNTPSVMREIEHAAQTLAVQLHTVEIRDPRALEPAFATMNSEHIGALIVPPDPLTHRHRQRVVELAATHRLPAIYGVGRFMEVGGLMFYGTTLRDNWHRAAVYVDKILRGATPGDRPIERPTKFDLVINLKTAKALGLTISPSLLYRADKVIK